MLALQILDRIEFIHSKNIIHRDIKPENFLLGYNNSPIIYIIDFGISRKYRSSRTGKHIKFSITGKLFGTVRYVSFNASRGVQQSRRDDLESIGYMLLYIMKGKLPWQGINLRDHDRKNKYMQMLILKRNIMPELLCRDLPPEFAEYVKYCKNLKFEEDPNYEYLRNLFKNVLEKIHEKNDLNFSWNKQIFFTRKNSQKEINQEKYINLLKRKESPQTRLYRIIQKSLEKNENFKKRIKESFDNENPKNRGASEDAVKFQSSRYKELDTTDISNDELSYNSLMAHYNMNIMKFQDENKIFNELNSKKNNSNKIKDIPYEINKEKIENKMNNKSCRSFDNIYNKEEKNILKKQFNNKIDLDKNHLKSYNYIIPHSEEKKNMCLIKFSKIINNNNLNSSKIKEININRRNVFNFNKIKTRNKANKQRSIDLNNKISKNKNDFSFKNMKIINSNSYLNMDRNINTELEENSQQEKYSNLIKNKKLIYNNIKVNNAIKRTKINSNNINFNISNILNNRNRKKNKKINIIINNNLNSFSKNSLKKENLINRIYLNNGNCSNDYKAHKYVNKYTKDHYKNEFIKLAQKRINPIELTNINRSIIFKNIKRPNINNSSCNIINNDNGIYRNNYFQIKKKMNILDYRPLYNKKQKSNILNKYSYNNYSNTSMNSYLHKDSVIHLNSVNHPNNFCMNNEAKIIELNKRILRQNRTPSNEYNRNYYLLNDFSFKNNHGKGVIRGAKIPHSNSGVNIIKNNLKYSSDMHSYINEYKNNSQIHSRLERHLHRHISPLNLRNTYNLNYAI
jgi:serine/threonine protein kinase